MNFYSEKFGRFLEQLPKSERDGVQEALNQIYAAECRGDGLEVGRLTAALEEQLEPYAQAAEALVTPAEKQRALLNEIDLILREGENCQEEACLSADTLIAVDAGRLTLDEAADVICFLTGRALKKGRQQC